MMTNRLNLNRDRQGYSPEERRMSEAADIAERLERQGKDGLLAMHISHQYVSFTDAAKTIRDLLDDLADVEEWRQARRAFLAIPAGKIDARTSPEAAAAFNRLSEAENRLYNDPA